MQYHEFILRVPKIDKSKMKKITRWLLPTPGNVIFSLVLIASLFWAESVNAFPWNNQPALAGASTGTWPYQGRLADSAGNPITNVLAMTFRIYSASEGGAVLWEEKWDSVQVSSGLFNVMLGSLTPIQLSIVNDYSSLWLGITVGTDTEMIPRVQLGSVPFAAQALSVPDGSITNAKLANDSISTFNLVDASVTTLKLADGSVTQTKLGADITFVPPDGSVTTTKIANGAVNSSNVKLTHGEIYGSGTVVPLTTTPQTVPEFSFTVNPTTPQVIVIHITLDFDKVPTCTTVIANTFIDDVQIGPVMTMGGDTRATISTVRQVGLSTGTHAITIRAWCENGPGGYVYTGQSSVSYLLFSQ